MTSPDISDSPQLKLMHSFIEGFKNRDLDQIAKLLHKDHRRITYPRSLGKPEQTKEEYLQHTAEVLRLCVDGDPIVHSIIEAPGKVIAHLTCSANTSIGVQMNREMILIAHAAPDDDGSLKLKQIEEFTDSQAYLDFFKAATAAKANEVA
ncbi:hypothetical protein BJ322DRAFT_1073534, partial [Thelephora terrestris]